MRGLLQKPWFVGIMSVLALIMIYNNVIEPMMPNVQSVSQSAISNMSKQVPFLSKILPSQKQKSKTKWEELAEHNIERNPFMEGAYSPEEVVSTEPLEWPTVSAIIYGSSNKLAIIDGNIVQEGEIVSGFKAVQIKMDMVRMRQGTWERELAVNEGEEK